MEWYNGIIYILMLAIPTIILAWTALTIWQKFLDYQQKKHEVATLQNEKENKAKIILPLKLQSIERIILFLERIAPENLIFRIHKPGMSAKQLHGLLVDAIQKEYEHNLAQQVYVSTKSWEYAKNAKEDTLHVVNLAVNKMKDNSTGLELSHEIFQILSKSGISPSKPAIEALRNEMKPLL